MPQSQSKQSSKQHPVQGAMRRILATPDGALLKSYMTGVIVSPSYKPGQSHDDMIHIEGQRMAFRQLLSFAGASVLSADEIAEHIEGADND